jgi:hypothetical protein
MIMVGHEAIVGIVTDMRLLQPSGMVQDSYATQSMLALDCPAIL